MSDHKKLYTENGTMHYEVFSVLMKDISNPRLLSKWCKDNKLKGYWYYEWNANTSEGGNNRWVTYAFHTVDHSNLFFKSFTFFIYVKTVHLLIHKYKEIINTFTNW